MTTVRYGALLINLGTPDAPTTPAVRRYLREFLSDPDVIDLPAPVRFALVNAVIVPFRAPKSAHAYQSIWSPEGSPLRVYTQRLADKVRQHRSEAAPLAWGMRYGNPGVGPALESLRSDGVTHLTVLPLYPQFAQSTVTSTVSHVHAELARLRWSPEVSIVEPFHRDDGYLASQAELIRPVLEPTDHLLFSFHGLPERHVLRSSPSCGKCLKTAACERLEHAKCYRGQCYETAHALAEKLCLTRDRYSVSFQSRLGRDPWIQPATTEHLEALLAAGTRRVVVAFPSFVADGLESLEEIGLRERERFLAAGGERLEIAPCPNDDDRWAAAVARMVSPGVAA